MTGWLEGGCLCAAVRYRIDGAGADAGYCHCRICQRSTGAPVLAWVTVPAQSFLYTRGVPTVYRSSEHGQREFCAQCGTQLLFRHVPLARTVDATVASLDDPASIAPQYHVWRGSRIPWFETGDELPRFDDAGPDPD